MVSNTVLNSVAQQTIHYGHHKIPRFIYHLTTKENYESMLSDQFIKRSSDTSYGKGVFAIELENFCKRWIKPFDNYTLGKELIKRISKGNDNIVILKIPTAKLKQEMLRIRSQNIMSDWAHSEEYNAAAEVVKEAILNAPEAEENQLFEIAVKTFKNFMKRSPNKEISTHITEGIPAKDSNLFKQRKHAIEYIYDGDIPMSIVEKIGECNIAQVEKTSGYDWKRPIRSIFKALLSKTPEVKNAELINY